jgi:hypothetical protein
MDLSDTCKSYSLPWHRCSPITARRFTFCDTACSLVARFHVPKQFFGIMRFPKEAKLRLGANLANSRALIGTCFPATNNYTFRTARCRPMQPLASMSSTNGNYCPLCHWQAACLNNNNPCSHPPSSHAVPSLHVFTPFQVNFLPLLVHRPSAHDGRSSPLTPTQPCLQQAGSLRPRASDGTAPIFNHRSPRPLHSLSFHDPIT